MLNSKEEKLIRENARNFYHVVSCNAHLFGEPFLENNYLYYFDGSVVTMISPRIKSETDKASINETIENIIAKHSPDNLIFWGETPTLDINNQKGYKVNKRNISVRGNEMVFKSSDFVPTKKYKKYLKKAEKENLLSRQVDLSYYKSEYTKLLADIHPNMLGIKSTSHYAVYPNAKETKFFETLKEGKVVAVHIVIELLPNYVCLGEIGYDKSFKGLCSMADVLVTKHYLDKAKYISWGSSPTEGVYDFKKGFLGEIPICFYNNCVWHEFYKKKKAEWWLQKMSMWDKIK